MGKSMLDIGESPKAPIAPKPPPVSEIVYITLHNHIDLAKPDGIGYQELKKAKTVLGAQNGFGGSYHGRTSETSKLLIWVINWQDMKCHMDFKNHPTYEKFETIFALLGSWTHSYHVLCEPPLVIREAPVTEYVTFHDCNDSFYKKVERFLKAIDAGKPEGYFGYGYGQVYEKIAKHTGDQRRTGTAVALFIGWESKKKHLAFQKTRLFLDNVDLLRLGTTGKDMFHVPFTL